MLGEKKVFVDKKEWDLDLREVALMEAQAQGLNPRDNCEELMEHVELRRRLEEAVVAHITKAGQLTILVGDISKVLVDLGTPPIPRILSPRGGRHHLGIPM
jgi:hypothetical protein